jgi:hypothetical protein
VDGGQISREEAPHKPVAFGFARGIVDVSFAQNRHTKKMACLGL